MTLLLTVILMVSRLTQVPLVMVQIKEYVPAAFNPLTAEDGLVGFAIIADEDVVQVPLPGAGEFPLSVAVGELAQIC